MPVKQKAAQTEPSLNVEQWPIDRVIGYARNPRKISDSAVSKVASSIKEYGWRQPIVVDGEGVIVVGHTRLAAAEKLGLTTVPVHVAADMTPQQVKAYRLADNRTSEENEWDGDLLALELGELAAIDFDMALTGFDGSELSELMFPEDQTDQEPGASSTKEIDSDEFQMECRCPRCGFEFDPKS